MKTIDPISSSVQRTGLHQVTAVVDELGES